MRRVFADTAYWVAILNPRDAWYGRALALSASLRPVILVTTRDVLVEVLNFYSEYGAHMRDTASSQVLSVLEDEGVVTIGQSDDLFAEGLALYRDRLDKEYSLTDCISMVVMRQMRLWDALTTDGHFAQEGFVVLMGE